MATALENTKDIQVFTIPLAELVVPPWNPRKFMDEAKMADLTAYLEKGGLVPRIWVWKGNNQGPWLVISGQRRLEAHRRLGKTAMEVEILDISLEEAKRLAFASNQDEEMHWWETRKAIGEMALEAPNQRDLAAQLGVSQATVSRSKQILEALNPSAQAMLDLVLIKKSPTPDLPETVVYALTGLFDPQGDKAEGQARVEGALKVALDRKLTEAQAKKLVEWVRNGNSPEKFTDPGKGAKGERSKVSPQPDSQSPEILASKPEPKDPKPLHLDTFTPSHQVDGFSQIGTLIAGKELGKKLHLPSQITNQLIPTFARHFQRVIGLFERLGVKNRVAATILALFLVLTVGSTLIGWSNRLMRWIVSYWAYSGPALSLSKGYPVTHPHVFNPNVAESVPVAQAPAQAAPSNPVTSAQASNSNPVSARLPAVSDQWESNSSNSPALSEQSESKPSGDSSGEATTKSDSTNPQTASGSVTQIGQKKGNPLKDIGDAVHGLSNAVNTAKEGESAVDGAKKIFGF